MESHTTHVIFDLDGTLLDTEPLYTIAAEQVCARYGATFTLQLKQQIMGGDSKRGARVVIDTLGLPISPEDYLAQREESLLQLFETAEPMPHAHELVQRLSERGVPMAIATSGHTHLTEAKLARHPFLRDVPVRICGNDPRLKRGKPAPDIFLLAALELGAEPARCAVIEDSVLGVQAAQAAGMRAIAVVDRRHGLTLEQFASADCAAGSLGELSLADLGL